MTDAEAHAQLKKYESIIEQLIKQGKSAEANGVFNAKLELISTRFARDLQEISDFFKPGTSLSSLENTNESYSPNDLEESENQIINSLINQTQLLIEENNYIEALKVADECNNYIKKRLQKWEESPSQAELEEVSTDPSHVYHILFYNSWSDEQKMKYLRKYLIRDLEDADRFRWASTPRNQMGCFASLDVRSYDNPENRTNLINELRNSPFKDFLIQFRQRTRKKVILKGTTLDTKATLNYLATRAPQKEMISLVRQLDFLSDIAHYNGKFEPMARALVEAAESAAADSAAAGSAADTKKNNIQNCVVFQACMKRLLELHKEGRSNAKVLELIHDRRNDFDIAFLNGLIAYNHLILQIHDIRHTKNITYFPETAKKLEENITAEIAKYLPDGRLVGRRMQTYVNQMLFANMLDRFSQTIARNKATSARISLEIEEDLLNSQEIKERIAKIGEYVRVEEEKSSEEEDLFDEFSASEKAQQQQIASYGNQLKPEEAETNQQQEELRTSTQPREPEYPASTNATCLHPRTPSAEITEEIYRLISLWCWRPFRGKNVLNIGGPLGRNVRLTIPNLVHIFRRHYYKTADPAFLKSKNDLIGPEVEVGEIIPMIKDLVQNMNSKQLKEHYDEMSRIHNKRKNEIELSDRENPYSFTQLKEHSDEMSPIRNKRENEITLSDRDKPYPSKQLKEHYDKKSPIHNRRTDKIQSSYKGEPYSLILRDNDVLSVYPNQTHKYTISNRW